MSIRTDGVVNKITTGEISTPWNIIQEDYLWLKNFQWLFI